MKGKGGRHVARDSKGRFARVAGNPRLMPVPGSAIMQLELFKEQPTGGDADMLIQKLLGPLRLGRPVVLAVTDKRMPKKMRTGEKPLLFLTPASCFGGSDDKLVIGLQAQGCEILDISKKVKSIAINRTGLGMALSRELAAALNLVFRLD